ncbi:MAG: methionyl-tRNA formyltransferase [Clostridiales bacterium]|nr:methionyl-tRNA formyltransferase [Clostridiales bacterium]
MDIVYMGTPQFAVPTLSAVAGAGHSIKYAVTQPDKARGRGNKIQGTPVKEMALSLGIEVLQPEKLKGNADFASRIAGCKPDLILTAAYGMILPPEILSIPRLGCINLHASLLPRWRGAAPIQRAIIEGDEETGVTAMFMAEGIDTGDIILSSRTAIGRKTAFELEGELAAMGADLIVDVVCMIGAGTAQRAAQDEKAATYAPMVSKKDGMLDFSKSPEELDRVVRGVNPWPGAFTVYKGETMKIWEAFPTEGPNPHEPGTITGVSGEGIEISAGGGTLVVTEIQMPGKKRVKIKEYLKGNKIEKFAVLR